MEDTDRTLVLRIANASEQADEQMHGHTHHDSHRHHHAPSSGRVLAFAVVLTLVFAAVEALAGWWAGSLALLGDAGHMISDALALGFAALAAWIAQRPPTLRHSYGLGRAEVVAAVVNGVFLLVVVIGIVVEAIQRIHTPQPVAGGTVMTIAALGLVVNGVVLWILARGEHSLNVRGAMLHVFGDLFGSIAALISGAVIYLSGWTLVDPILSLFICGLILFSSLKLLREALHVLMEGVPLHLDLAEVGRALARADRRVHSVHDLHIWTLSSGRIALSAHIVLDNMQCWDEVLLRVRELLAERFDIDHVTVQPESTTHVLYPMPREPENSSGASDIPS